MRKARILIAVILFVVIALSIMQVVVANSIATHGIELAHMQSEIKKIKRENFVIREKILQKSSLTEIASRAGELGFVRSTKNVYLSAPLPLAKR
jgi:hypothetical protein